MRRWRSQYWFAAAVCLFGVAVLVALAYACLLAGVDFATAGFLLLVVVVVISIQGNYVCSVVLSVTAVGCLVFFFSSPIFNFRVEKQEDVIALFAFLTTSIIITGLSARIRKMSEDELHHTRAELARFARVAILGELTASIAHEVNQPLAGVVSSGDACRRWLANQPPNIERANQSLERIIRDADRARKIVERVRGLARKAPPQKAAVSVREALREVIVLTRGEVEQNQIRVEAQFADDLPLVWADRIQLQQVCLNLILNAIEAIKDLRAGPRNLLVRAEKDPTDSVLLTVSDTGAGLDSEKWNKSSAPSTPPSRKVWAWDWRSAAPSSKPTAGGCGHRTMFPEARSFSSRCRLIVKGRHDMSVEQPLVFVVDDDASAREGIEDILQSVGLPVMSFGSAQEFLQRPRPDAPGCIVLDVRLPGTSGLEFQKVLIQAGIRLPVIFITGHGDIPMSVMAMKSGAIEFLTKPLREQSLLDAVNAGIEGDRLRRQASKHVSELQLRFELLTPREREVFALVVTGRPNKQIAAQLELSEMTVKVHRSQITKKMRANSIVDLARMADRLGLSAEKS